MIRRGTLLLAWTVFAATVRLFAADAPYPIRPASQPLLAARAADARTVSSLLAAAPALALRLDQYDYRGTLPGLGAETPSLRGLLDRLDESGATNLWYCLAQSGSSLATTAAGTGWRWPAGFSEERGETWMRDNSLAPDLPARSFTAEPSGGHFMAVAKKAEALAAITRGRTENTQPGWRRSLDRFLSKPTDAVGIWVNSRPLLGVAALASGVDLRGALARLKLSLPYAAWLEADRDDGEGIGIEFGVDGLLPEPVPGDPDAALEMHFPLPAVERPFVRLTLAAPYPLLRALGLESVPVYLANLDAKSLVPRLATLDIWVDDAGATRWSLLCLMGEKSAFLKHFRRLAAWANLLAGLPDSFIGISPLPPDTGMELYSVDFRGRSALAGIASVANGDRENVFLIAAERREDFPDAGGVEIKPGHKERALSWRVGLDDESRLLVARRFIFQAAQYGLPQVKSADFAMTLPREETGYVTIRDDCAAVSSPRGMALWLAPTLPGLLREAERAWRFEPAGE